MAYYLNQTKEGLKKISSFGDGDRLTIEWYRAYPNLASSKIGYNIYIDEQRPDFEVELFRSPPSYLSISNKISGIVRGLEPGQVYRIGVRAIEYSPSSFDTSLLNKTEDGLLIYPTSQLRSEISDTALVIPIMDSSEFPDSGTIKIGKEIIVYGSVDRANDDLLLTSALQRGFRDTLPSYHEVDGYYSDDPYSGTVILYPVIDEEQNTVVYAKENAFDYPNYAFTLEDGYRQTTKDLLNSDLSYVETSNETFSPLDTSGYHRIDTAAYLRGECVGSYFGGEQGCIDGYGFSHRTRGLSVQDMVNQREEKLLSLTGEAMILLKRQTTGIRCRCINPQQEHPDARCVFCLGSGFVVGYNQFFNPRRADRRIMVRFESWVEQVPLTDSGLEVEQVRPNAWTGTEPIINPRDIIIRFNEDGNEEFRYEVLTVTRNILFEGQYGAQKLTLARIRKTDHIYSAPYFKDGGMMPGTRDTSSAITIGLPLHHHTITTNENDPTTWGQITTMAAGHSHIVKIVNGILTISTELGHSHSIL